MHVALDATPLTLTSGGLLRYTTELSLALARTFPEDQFTLMSDQSFRLPADGPSNLLRDSGPRHGLDRRWWLWGIERGMMRSASELFHGTNFAVPYLPRRPSVLTLHDLSPWMLPEWHNGAGRVRKRTPALIGLHLATMVVTVSEAVRSQAIERFGIHPSRIAAVPNAASALFRPIGGLPLSPPVFLFVGTLEPRKNVGSLIEAWLEVRRADYVELWLAGRRRDDFGSLPDHDGLKWLGEVPDKQLPELYSSALAVVYPSSYEGFGLPVLEAMSCGACVITSADPALCELTAGAGLEARDTCELVAAMRTVLTRPELVSALRGRALARSRAFSWEQTARATREVYVEALRRRP